MNRIDLDLFKELNPEVLQKKFLASLLKIQNVQRGSIWIQKEDAYVCVEAAGEQSDQIRGVSLDVRQPSIVGWVIENRKRTVAEIGSDRRHCREVEDHLAVKSSLILCFPLFFRDRKVYGALQVIDTRPEKNSLNLDQGYLDQIQNLVDICSIALSNALLYADEKKKRLSLQSALQKSRRKEDIIGQSPAFRKCMDLVKSYSDTDFPVLITGDSGTGKELVAERIHQSSHRKEGPFLVQNCGAIPETLLESELFGYKKGAFTGAVKDKMGLFEAAEGGTVFLDEIGDMPLSVQGGLLRVLQKNEIKPLGETSMRIIDVRIVAATNRDIRQMVAEGRFRRDLFYRLSVLPVHLPSLGDRREDIPLLTRHFLQQESIRLGGVEKNITPRAMQALVSYAWPGNIRELENLIRYLVVITGDADIDFSDLPFHVCEPTSSLSPDREWKPSADPVSTDLGGMTWDRVEKLYVTELLSRHNWNVTWAARASGVNRSTFASRMRKLGIRRSMDHLEP